MYNSKTGKKIKQRSRLSVGCFIKTSVFLFILVTSWGFYHKKALSVTCDFKPTFFCVFEEECKCHSLTCMFQRGHKKKYFLTKKIYNAKTLHYSGSHFRFPICFHFSGWVHSMIRLPDAAIFNNTTYSSLIMSSWRHLESEMYNCTTIPPQEKKKKNAPIQAATIQTSFPPHPHVFHAPRYPNSNCMAPNLATLVPIVMLARGASHFVK